MIEFQLRTSRSPDAAEFDGTLEKHLAFWAGTYHSLAVDEYRRIGDHASTRDYLRASVYALLELRAALEANTARRQARLPELALTDGVCTASHAIDVRSRRAAAILSLTILAEWDTSDPRQVCMDRRI